MRAFVAYLFAATIFHFLSAIAYEILFLLDLTRPIDQWWDRQGGVGPVLYMFVYFLVVALVWALGVRQRWSINLRWIVEMGARRGLRIGGIPLVDFGLLLICLLLALVALRYSIVQFVQMLYLIGPLMFGIVVCLLTGEPDRLDDVITEPIRLRDYATKHGIDHVALAQENKIDPQDDPQFTFGRRIKLPLH